MKRAIRDEWCEALRSGYKQGKGALCRGDRFCCLGVLIDATMEGDWEWDDTFERYNFEGFETHLPAFAMDDRSPWFIGPENEGCLISMNDNGASFENIADWIERNVPVED